jgi:predicted polyphosphate/ATP-dependent NAD kinase
MTTVGIIANPAASKDIRRLVAHGRMVPDWEKVNIVRRVLLGLEAVGVGQVVAMPDPAHLCLRARDDPHISLDMHLLEMPVWGSVEDSVRAAGLMNKMNVGSLVTLGGDGTNRAVAKSCGQVPLVPISTGTNNVFPTTMEGTLAGMAAGVVAGGLVELDQVSYTSKRIEAYVDGELRDMALVDMAVSKERYVASRAVWDVRTLHEIILARADSASIGLSSIGARLHPVGASDQVGLYIRPGPGGNSVMAPIAPGMVTPVPIAEWRILQLGERVKVDHSPCTIALDGEREFTVLPGQDVEVVITGSGPRVVDLAAALAEATSRGVFTVPAD